MKPYSETEGPHWLPLFQLSRAVFVVMLGRSGHVDALSTWLLVTTGVAAAFLLSHLADLAKHTSSCYLRIGLILLGASALCGLCQKALAFIVGTAVAAEREITAHVVQTLAQAGPPLPPSDIQKLMADVIQEIREPAPRFLHRFIDSGAQKGAADPLFPLKRAMKQMFAQSMLCLGQLSFLVLALVDLALGVR